MPERRVFGAEVAYRAAGRLPPVREPLSVQESVELGRVFTAISDPVRLRLLSLISSHEDREACVHDLAEAVHLSGPTLVDHVTVLCDAGLISGELRGTRIYYRVRPELFTRLSEVFLSAIADGPTSDSTVLGPAAPDLTAVEASDDLAECLRLVLARLPPDNRPLPSVAVYDKLLPRYGGRS